MLSTCFEIFILQLAFFKSFKNLVMCFLFSLKNIPWGSRKILPGKIPTWKIPPIKFPSGKFSTGKLIVFLHYFFTQHFVHKWGKEGEGMYMQILPTQKILICPEQLNVPNGEETAIININLRCIVTDFHHETYRL